MFKRGDKVKVHLGGDREIDATYEGKGREPETSRVKESNSIGHEFTAGNWNISKREAHKRGDDN